jgi:peptidoglycan/xylan/chitin deacetylase (PgdA/CDA1 family)
MIWKTLARRALHGAGGLGVIRAARRRAIRVMMFHDFSEATSSNVDEICAHVARHYEPVTLSRIETAISGGAGLPDNAVAVTVDDGYRNFLAWGHPLFRKHKIPVSLFAISGFAQGGMWLWWDQVRFTLENARRTSIRAELLPDLTLNLDLSSTEAKAAAADKLIETLKTIPDEAMRDFLFRLSGLCGVELPPDPSDECAAMTWEELRAVSAEGTEIGCHTATHPILSRVSSRSQLHAEILGARETMEARLGFPVTQFCYPNGRESDIDEAAIQCVRDAGFTSAVTCTWGLNENEVDRLRIRRVPFKSDLDLRYGAELLCGLHL